MLIDQILDKEALCPTCPNLCKRDRMVKLESFS